MSRARMHQRERKHIKATLTAVRHQINRDGLDSITEALGAGSADDWPQDSAEHDNGPHGAKAEGWGG